MRKLILIALAAVFLFTLAAYALENGFSLTLSPDTPIPEQAEQLADYIAQFPPEKQQEWADALTGIRVGKAINPAELPEGQEGEMVYISDQGERYHRATTCRGLRNASTLSVVTREVALAMERTPCKLCFPRGDR